VRRVERAYAKELGVRAGDARDSPLAPGTLLAFAYPDRIGRRRPGADGRYQLASGRGAAFTAPESIAREDFIVAVHVDDRERDARILLAAPLTRADLVEHFGAELVRENEVAWDPRAEAVVARSTVRFGELVIEEKPLKDIPADAAAAAFVEGLHSLGLEALPWDDDARDLAARSEFVRHLHRGDLGDWPDLSNEALASDFAWLKPFLAGLTRRSQLSRVPLAAALRARLTHEQQRRLDELAPTHVTLPTGTRARIDYRDDSAPVASMRMQEVFGLAATPKIGGGAVPVTFKLLSPAHRPLQVTRDLASFWRNAYVDVRKDMRGRYPRHHWPENPLEAEPTRRAKPRK
jgi:ATP-dependent helicase HrpB